MIQTEYLYSRLATKSADFRAVHAASVLIGNGETEGRIPADVLPDVIPELAEKFTMKLTSVDLVDSDFISNPNFVPLLGNITVATLTIAANQDPHGLFALHIQDDNGSFQPEVVVMATHPGHSVQLYVQRLGEQVGYDLVFLVKLNVTTRCVLLLIDFVQEVNVNEPILMAFVTSDPWCSGMKRSAGVQQIICQGHTRQKIDVEAWQRLHF